MAALVNYTVEVDVKKFIWSNSGKSRFPLAETARMDYFVIL